MRKAISLALAVLLLLSLSGWSVADPAVPEELVGEWVGTGRHGSAQPIELTESIRADGSGNYTFVQGGYTESYPVKLSGTDGRFSVDIPENNTLGITKCEGTYALKDGVLTLEILTTFANGGTYDYTAECRKVPAPEEETAASPVSDMGADGPAAQPVKSYPFLENGYWHYGIRLDGEVLPLAHDAVIPVDDNKDNEILYPVSDILDYFGVQYFFNPEHSGTEFSTIVNGVTASRDPEDEAFMWFTNQQSGYGNCLAPRIIDRVFYAPNYFFEHTIGAVLTKIQKGKEESMEYVNIVTGAAYEWGPGALGEAVMRWGKDSYSITPPTIVEGTTVWEQPWPNPGEIYHNSAYTKDSRVTFHVKLGSLAAGSAVLVKIYAQNNDLVSCLFFTEASTQTVTLKAGTYTVKYASGPEWYGMYNTFGPGGHYQVMIFDNNKKTINLANNHEYELTINTSEHDKDSKNVGAEEVDPSDF